MLPARASDKPLPLPHQEATCRLICTLASLNASRVSRTSPGTIFDQQNFNGMRRRSNRFHDPVPFPARRSRKVEPCPGCDSTQMAPAKPLDNLLADGQSDAGAGLNSSRLCSRWNMPKIFSKYCANRFPARCLARKDPFLAAIFGGGDVHVGLASTAGT
jgi:hypothetical protein